MKRVILLLSAVLAVACNTTTELNVMSFNIRYDNPDDAEIGYGWASRRDAVAAVIRANAIDIFGTQEVLSNQFADLKERLPEYEAVGVGREDGESAGEHNAVFFLRDRFDLLDAGTFWLSETPDEVSQGWDGACKRTLTWAHLREKSTGKSFYYLNTHFDHRGPEARRQSALLVVDWVREHIPAEAAVIIGGDLNSSIDDPIFDPMKSEYLVARDIADPSDFEGTFNGFGSAPNNIVLDHFFCRGIDLEQKPVLMVLRGDYGAPYISDHYPVVFDFRLP